MLDYSPRIEILENEILEMVETKRYHRGGGSATRLWYGRKMSEIQLGTTALVIWLAYCENSSLLDRGRWGSRVYGGTKGPCGLTRTLPRQQLHRKWRLVGSWPKLPGRTAGWRGTFPLGEELMMEHLLNFPLLLLPTRGLTCLNEPCSVRL